MAQNQLKTRYLVIRLDIANPVAQASSNQSTTFSNGKTTKYVYAYSGSPLQEGMAYSKVDAIITQSIGWQDNTATVTIYGMNPADINTFTRSNLDLWFNVFTANLITIYAGYNLGSDGLPPIVFCGYVIFAGANYNNSRDRPFVIHSMQFFDLNNVNIKPTNPKGVISLDNLFRQICQAGNLVYRGYNITGNAYSPILTGTVRDQLQQACKRYGYQITMTRSPDNVLNIVSISPIGQPMQNSNITLSAQNNEMIGFPVVENYGFSIKCYFNPTLIVGQTLYVNSVSVPYINNKQLYINQMVHELHNREEQWQSTLQLNAYGTLVFGANS